MPDLVLAALITGPPTAMITALGAVMVARIGKPNGHGNVAQMTEKGLVELRELRKVVDAHVVDRRQHPPTWRARIADALDPKVNP